MVSQRRKNTRLDGWDYASHSAYHVTFCTKNRACTLGRVVTESEIDGRDQCRHDEIRADHVVLSDLGKECDATIRNIASNSQDVKIWNYVVMPNHVHLLVELAEAAKRPLGSVIGNIKAKVTSWAKRNGMQHDIWQRGFHEHIIRGSEDFEHVWNYIETNPAKWADDQYHRP